MSKIISIVNQKGGVGKTTTTGALSTGLKNKGNKTLMIDLDPQCNLTYSTGLNADNSPNIYNVLVDSVNIKDTIITSEQGDIVPSGLQLAVADKNITETGKEFRLQEALEGIKDNYDYIIIDTPPQLNILTINALTASDSVIITTQADIYSVQGVGNLNNTIQAVKKYCNQALKIDGILITRYNKRTIISRQMAELLEETADKLSTKVYNTKIRECIALKEAQAMKEDIYSYAPGSNATDDYMNFVMEVLEDN